MLNDVPVGVTKSGFKLGEVGHQILDDAVAFSDMMKDEPEKARALLILNLHVLKCKLVLEFV